MGDYINVDSKGQRLPFRYKAAQLIKDGAELLLETPKAWEPNLVCVVNNGDFEAAAYVRHARDLQDFSDPTDYMRPKVWLKYAHAEALSKIKVSI